MISRYIVSSPGRTASHIVVAMIQQAGRQAIHTHYPFYKTDNDTITGLVIVSRRNLFDAIMSNLVVNYTGQTTIYDKINFEKFTVSQEQFAFQYNWHKWYADNHDYSRPYGLIKTIYFEDFINNYNHILDELDLGYNLDTITINSNFTQKAPYNYRDLVINYNNCREWYDELNKTPQFVPVTEDDFKSLSDDERNLPWTGEVII